MVTGITRRSEEISLGRTEATSKPRAGGTIRKVSLTRIEWRLNEREATNIREVMPQTKVRGSTGGDEHVAR